MSYEISRRDYPGFEIPGGRRPKRSDPDGEAQNNPIVIIVDSPERA